jgi:exosortase
MGESMNAVMPGTATPESAPTADRRAGWDWRAIPPLDAACAAVVALALGFAYWPNLVSLYHVWDTQPDYSHGFLVLPIALAILYRRWPVDAADRPRVWLPALAALVAVLGARAWLYQRGSHWTETATILPAIAALGLARLGWRTMRATWPAFAYLLFWLPLPPQINSSLSQPLQSIATWASCRVLRMTGLWVMPEGNVIVIGGQRLEVAAACNGLSMLMSLAAAVAATAAIVAMAPVKRLVLLATIIPIALLSNVLRISATAWCYYWFGAEVGSKYAHDAAGWLMMPTAMAFVGLELLAMSWIVVETRERVAGRVGMGFPTLGEARPS